MVLNYIWVAFFLISFVFGLVKLLVFHDLEVFPAMMKASFDMAKTGFEISLWLTGAMSLWLGLMKIAEEGGIVKVLNRLVGPFFRKLFPDVPEGHPVITPILMNFSANMMGLDNAATPLGLKAMEGLQELNPKKDTASNSQIMFLVLNTSGLTILPISVMVYRQQAGALDPSDIFLPILLATYFSTLGGLIITSLVQKINLLDKTILSYLGGFSAFIGGLIYYLSGLNPTELGNFSSTASNVILFSFIIGFIVLGLRKKINVYDAFIEGAKEAFKTATSIIPYLVAMLVGIGVFRASGAMDEFIHLITYVVSNIGINTDFVDALPTAFMKPLSGSGARGMMVEAMNTHGVDSFVGRLSSVMQGSTDTTLFIIAMYFGSVKIRNTRHAILCGLFADLVGVIAAILLAYMFFG